MVEAQPPEEETNVCICGKERDISTVELFCSECKKWFHGACTSIAIENMMPFQLNYVFTCKSCNEKAVDHITKNKSTFLQACITTLGNLINQNQAEKRFYSKDKDIIPYMEQNWEVLLPNRQQSVNWTNHVYRALTSENIFSSETEADETFYTLLDEDLAHINPVLYKSSAEKNNENNSAKGGKKGGNTGKRKTTDANGAPGKKSKLDSGLHRTKLSKWGYPLEHPHNKDNYRYTLAEPDPLAGTSWEQELAAGKPLPSKHYRSKLSHTVLLALHDKASQLKVDEDRTTVTGEKGYSVIRATNSIKHGTFYYECTVMEMTENSACRIGWAQQYANLQAPCGYDKFGYSWRSRKGTIFHNSRGKHFSSGYGQGDTLGFLISLPKNEDPNTWLPPPYKDQALIKFKNHLYFEEKDESDKIEKQLEPSVGSVIKFYKNGVCEGAAWRDVYKGDYFPCISVYKNCVLNVNFGPDFKYPPKEEGVDSVSELADQAIIKHTLGDLLYHVEDRMNTDHTSLR